MSLNMFQILMDDIWSNKITAHGPHTFKLQGSYK